jgi:energy-coupling factor transporter ATP-binding protein EcfA2
MRLQSISMAWFRGAADCVRLELDGKSAVIYGSNGSGKSSFVDAVEYAMTGRIGHLAHEYSGKRQERALINTHIPADIKSEVRINFADESETMLTIDKSGLCQRTDSATSAITNWSLKRTILRQDEVADFIRETKGAKYSALLPLLGLGALEVAAENLRQLARSVDAQSKRQSLRAELGETDRKRKAQFGASDDSQIRTMLVALHVQYGLAPPGVKTNVAICEDLGEEITRRVNDSSADQRRFIALNDVGASGLAANIEAVRNANSTLAGAAEPLIFERLNVLKTAKHFSEGLIDSRQLTCPACGQAVSEEDFKAHITAEQLRLQEMLNAYESRRLVIDALVQTVRTIKARLSSADTKAWLDVATNGPLGDSLAYLATLNTQQLTDNCNEVALAALESNLVPLITAVANACVEVPPGAAQLATDKQVVDVGRIGFESIAKTEELARADALATFVRAVETAVREHIRESALEIVGVISADIQAMWSILHPDKSIKNVHLYVTSDADKAIDIGLQFHGVEQNSPRLTLSEGYRNSLGLCIFLAMAKREASTDRPVVLDDVVVSLDRDHRGMIVELLNVAFASRQVVVLTHDRDWYAEMRLQLDNNNWAFRALLPYESPPIGIRWSTKTTTFGDARAQLKDRPDSAGNDARKIMDVELAAVAERLQLRLPYRRGDRNDKRTAHDFLERLIADGKDSFQVKVDSKWEPNTGAIEKFEAADGLLVTWGNKASHSFDVVRPEATKIINACEAAVASFKCASCKKHLWHANVTGEKAFQCECGQLRWR